MSKLNSNIKLSFILILFTFITYFNILPNKLFYDDEELIYKNAYVADLHYFPRYFVSNMIEGAGKKSNMYRPILITSYAVDHLFWGNNPFGYHLTSILLHAANGILIFFLADMLLGNKMLSFLTSIFFIVHPVQSEAVAYASGRTDLLFTFFGLISIILYLSFIRSKRSAIKYWVGIGFFVLGLLTKESAIVLPFLLLLCGIILQKRPNLDRLVITTLPYFLVVSAYVILRMTVLNFMNVLNFYPENNLYSSDIFARIFTFSGVFFRYLAIIFFPKELIFTRSTPIIASIVDKWVLAFILVVTLSFWVAIKRYKQNRVYLFSLFWFFITLVPVSGVIPINSIIAEHFLYLPAVGIFLIVASITQFFFRQKSKIIKSAAIIGLVFIISVFIVRTINRNYDWRDPVVFYTKSLSQSPRNIPMMNNLAMAYADRGQLDLAIDEYKKVINTADVYPNTHHNLGNAYKELGKYQEAEEEYYKALKIDPNFMFSYFALADLYRRTGDQKKLEAIMVQIEALQKTGKF